ncbi:MAG: DUF924 family protein [Gammaproteobacteria bacterium]
MITPMQRDIDRVLDFWFGELRDGSTVEDRSKLWFGSDVETDELIKKEFGSLHASAVKGELDGWRETPGGRLALIILFDQFSRNIFRGTAEAFACDPAALQLCLEGLETGADKQLAPVERDFFYLPLEHSETLAHQDSCVQRYTELMESLPAGQCERVKESLGYAVQHRDIIERFGRFPHRNRALNRDSTAEELAYLKGKGSRFGQ